MTMTIYEMRTYTVQVGKMPEAIRLYSQFGYPALHKGEFDKKLVGYFISYTGTLHQLVHLWKFDDDADRRAHWAALFADTDFIDFYRRVCRPVPPVGPDPGGQAPDRSAVGATSLSRRGTRNCSRFVARRRGVSPRCGREHRLQRREPLQGLLVPMDILCTLRHAARNGATCFYSTSVT